MSRSTYTPLSGEEHEDLSQSSTTLNGTSSATNGSPNARYSEEGGGARQYYTEDQQHSDSEEDEFLEKNLSIAGAQLSPGIAETGYRASDRTGLVVGGEKKTRPASIKVLVSALVVLVTLSGIIGIFASVHYNGSAYHPPGTKKITMDHVFNGTFNVERKYIDWVKEAGDGVFSTEDGGHIKLVDLKTNTSTDLLSVYDVTNEFGGPFSWAEWKLSADMKYILVKGDYHKQWRWSSFGNYFVHEIGSRQTRPIIKTSHPATTAYAVWSPTGQAIAFVHENDLFYLPSPRDLPIRLTITGTHTVSNGVPPWVYEEEVYSAASTLWFSPSSSKLAYLAFDETEVPEYTFPVYNPTEDSYKVIPYPGETRMRYPKPGYPNPRVLVKVVDLAGLNDPLRRVDENIVELRWDGMLEENGRIVFEVKWIDERQLIVKEVNRNADKGAVVLFDITTAAVQAASVQGQGVRIVHGTVVRKLGKDGEEGDNGWIESSQNIYPLSDGGYVDVVPTKDGYNHIALFRPANSSTPRFLSSGEWEVSDGIKAVDDKNGIVYFRAASPSSIERQIYAVNIPAVDQADTEAAVTELTQTDETYGIWNAEFSPEAGFYLLSYDGPGIPWSSIVKVGDKEFDYPLTNNEKLRNATELYESAVVSYSTIMSDGYELNVKEIRPPRMDDSGRSKYPVLFKVYGGPGSQMVDVRFNRDWEYYLACSHQYVVVIVDGRGTGYKGRALRNVVKGNLGFFETKDQINAAKLWAAKDYVDSKRIGIWGWSYGGFMASKVVEADAGVHSLSMAVAPVISWRMYDSIYTERYMNLPNLNVGGYVNASISNVTAFDKVDYLLAHGSGDDNVHYANSAHMLDMLTKAQIRKFRFRMFTDSDHSMSKRGAYRELYETLTAFLIEKWGKGPRRRT